jgi:hypothetical protein
VAPKWPSKTVGAIAALFRTLQDVDVYVEDKESEGFYAELLKVACSGTIRIARVLPLEGRKQVIEAAKAHDFSKRPALFLVDGDFEWVRDEPAPQVPGVYRLDAYCVENLLLCNHAATQYLMECEACDETRACVLADFDAWQESVLPLVDLFAAWAALNRVHGHTPTVSTGIGQFLESKPVTSLDAGKVESAVQAALSRLAQERGGLELLGRVRSRIAGLERPLDCVSGKDFLLPALDFHIRLKTKEKSSRAALRFRLARHASVARLNGLDAALTRAARNVNAHW